MIALAEMQLFSTKNYFDIRFSDCLINEKKDPRLSRLSSCLIKLIGVAAQPQAGHTPGAMKVVEYLRCCACNNARYLSSIRLILSRARLEPFEPLMLTKL